MRQPFLVAVVLSFAIQQSLAAQDEPAIPLPSDKSTTVIQLDYRGGFGPPRKNQSPRLAIQADGKATVTDPTGERLTETYMLSETVLQNVLRDIVYEHDFLNIDHGEISRAIGEEDSKTGFSMTVFDAPIIVILLKTADREHELRYDTLRWSAEKYLAIQPLQRLKNVTNRLERLIAELRPGVRDAIAVALSEANEAIEREHPGQALLTLNDSVWAEGEGSGPQTVRFFRIYADRSRLTATVTLASGTTPQVTTKIEPEPLICTGEGNNKRCFSF